MKKILRRILVVAVLLLVCYAAVQDRMGLPVLFPSWQEVSESSAKILIGPYKVLYVTDGDTLRVEIDGADTYVRLIGIDAPESASHNPEVNTEEGQISAEYLRGIVRPGMKVWLEYDENKADQYGRTLAYVYLDAQGKDMLEVRILKDGMARTLHIKPNDKYYEYFYELEEAARADRKGFWATEIWN